MPDTHLYELDLEGVGAVPTTVTVRGSGRPVLLLHGGAGPQSVAEFADLLAAACSARVFTPVHPGFGGTVRPDALDSISRLAALYSLLLDELDLTDVTVIGNSVGGWVTAELALLRPARVARIVLLDATGIEVDGHPVADLTDKTLPEILALGFHNPAPFLVDPSTLPPAAQQIAAGNRKALAAYSGTVGDPELLARLGSLGLAALVLWGQSDEVVDRDYGRAYAAAIPGATFRLLPDTGHNPQLETPEQVVTAIADFLTSSAAWEHDYTQNTTVPADAVWAALRNLYTGLTQSDTGDDICLHGPFATGAALSVTPHGADFVVHCVITELDAGKTYAYRSHFNNLYLTSRHTLVRLPGGGTRITHHSVISGPGAEVVGLQLGPRITEDRPQTMHALIDAAATLAEGPVRADD